MPRAGGRAQRGMGERSVRAMVGVVWWSVGGFGRCGWWKGTRGDVLGGGTFMRMPVHTTARKREVRDYPYFSRRGVGTSTSRVVTSPRGRGVGDATEPLTGPQPGREAEVAGFGFATRDRPRIVPF